MNENVIAFFQAVKDMSTLNEGQLDYFSGFDFSCESLPSHILRKPLRTRAFGHVGHVWC